MKIIRIDDCMKCPFYGKCKAWLSLSRKEKVALTIGVGLPKFILKDCHLEDDPDRKVNVKPSSSGQDSLD